MSNEIFLSVFLNTDNKTAPGRFSVSTLLQTLCKSEASKAITRETWNNGCRFITAVGKVNARLPDEDVILLFNVICHQMEHFLFCL